MMMTDEKKTENDIVSALSITLATVLQEMAQDWGNEPTLHISAKGMIDFVKHIDHHVEKWKELLIQEIQMK